MNGGNRTRGLHEVGTREPALADQGAGTAQDAGALCSWVGGSAPLSPVMKAWPGTRTLSPPALGRPGREFFPDPSQPAPLERPLVRTEAHAPPGRGL